MIEESRDAEVVGNTDKEAVDNRGGPYYLDVFDYGACLGDKFPVNTFYHFDLDIVLRMAEKVIPQVDRVEISRRTKGLSPSLIQGDLLDRVNRESV